MYMSGRALHAVTTNLALRLSEEFRGDLLLSFAGGADAFNVTDLLRSGMATITVCSDLLKTGGYLRLPQYIEELNLALDKAEAADLTDLAGRTALAEHHYQSFSDDYYINLNLNTEMDLPQSRETVLHYFEQIQKKYHFHHIPILYCQFHRLVLQEHHY